MKDGSSCSSCMCMCPVTWVSQVLLVVGGLNWALVGFWDFNLVTYLVDSWPMVEQGVYGLVGLSALWTIWKLVKSCCNCSK